ncbi:hypothetical protein DMV_gp7 [Dracaena mottle virus]|uniref:Uncharacterized protein n=1 Tax=Dracaena mottle virus TaxID=380669 RepID=Q1KLC9_9VIRU|nr:hypothetical protein DMV_gp7 [Dracaena mottle virus]ABE77348.1 hypothetical protein [Dracaena mottle virus]
MVFRKTSGSILCAPMVFRKTSGSILCAPMVFSKTSGSLSFVADISRPLVSFRRVSRPSLTTAHLTRGRKAETNTFSALARRESVRIPYETTPFAFVDAFL